MESTKVRLLRFLPAIVIGLLFLSMPGWIGRSIVSLVTEILIYGLLAMSLDFVFGYTGLWSFCHAALFGVAAYTDAILITKFGITSFWLAAPAGIVMAAIFAAFFAWIGFRVSGIYFLLITLALGEIVYTVCETWQGMTGGSEGIINVPYPDLGIHFTSISFYYFTLIIVVICAFILYRIIKSPFGHSLQGIRENETRMLTLGFNTWRHKFYAFIISGVFAGMAGILYVYYNGVILPGNVDMIASGFVTILIIIGSTGTLWGGLLGSAIVYTLSYYVSLFTPERWPLVLGACFVAVVMFARGGVFLQLSNLWTKLITRRSKLATSGIGDNTHGSNES